MRKRLDVQKDEYEETIKRHLSFIDQVNVFVNIFIYFFFAKKLDMRILS